MTQGSSEDLLESFKAAALSVTKLYKISAAAQNKARLEGYQECIEDVLAFLDRENIGLGDGEGWLVRSWATERLNGDAAMNTGESDDDELSAPEPPRSAPPSTASTMSSSVASLPATVPAATTAPVSTANTPVPISAAAARPSLSHSGTATMSPAHSTSNEPDKGDNATSPMASAPAPTSTPLKTFPTSFTVPTADTFTFQSGIAYPNIDQLALSDTTPTAPRTSLRSRNTSSATSRNSQSRHLGRGAGHKRRINIEEIFDVGDLGNGKDMFGSGSKRNRHT